MVFPDSQMVSDVVRVVYLSIETQLMEENVRSDGKIRNKRITASKLLDDSG